ncbi:MAG: SH3 domain-containing protein [Caldilineaceae bacterium]|nr:SH3 domain-containing protein [Caldilineaceae bacterium]MDE0340128.1 SH3 domain-containing protein [Caldilineaceae bacterium]
MRALLLALILVAAVALLAGLFSGLDFLPFGEDYNQTTYEQPPSPPDTTISDAGNPGFTVDEDSVEVRAGYSSDYRVIGVVYRGQTFTPNGRTQAGDWLQFPWEGGDGWIQVQQLTVTGLDQIPVVGRIPPPPPPDLPHSDSPPPDSPPPDPSTPGSSPGGPTGPPPSE